MIRRTLLRVVAATGIGLLTGTVHAAVDSCFRILGHPVPLARTIKVVAVDRSTPLNDSTEAKIVDMIGRWVVPGDRFILLSFAGPQGATFEIETDFTLDPGNTLNERVVGDIPTGRYMAFRKCLDGQLADAASAIRDGMKQVFDKKFVDEAGISPIFWFLAQIAPVFRDAPGERSGFVLISDGIQHEAPDGKVATTFYGAPGRVRPLNVQAEIEKIREAGQMPDLLGVRVWHMAMGQPGIKDDAVIQRNAVEVANLRAFYTVYWREAKAQLIDIGTPIPLRALR